MLKKKKVFQNHLLYKVIFQFYISIVYLERFWFWQNRKDWTFNSKTKMLLMVGPCGI